jgi:uncharacterized protein (DUF885 family)
MLKKLVVWLILCLLLAGCSGEVAEAPVATVEEVLEDFLEENPSKSVEEETEEQEFAESVPVEELTAPLVGLPIGEFFEQAFRLILLRDPELVLEMGMPGLELDQVLLTDVSIEALDADNQVYRQILDLLRQYDLATLTEPEYISYQVFEWYLMEEIRAYEDCNFLYLVTPLNVRSEPQLYVLFFTDSHPFNTSEDAEDYVARIHLLDEKIDQLIERMEAQAEAGVIAPHIVLEYGQLDFKRAIGSNANNSPLRFTFREKAPAVLSDEKMTALEEELLTALKDEVYPAFGRLDSLINELMGQAPKQVGYSSIPGGADYYQRQLDHFTTTGLTAKEIHTAGLTEVARIQAEMRARFSDLGYPEDESIPELYQRLISDSGTLSGNAITAEYERILAEADELVAESFERRPPYMLEVIGGDVGAYYSPGSFDGTRLGRFYARITSPVPVYRMRSLSYHEGIPGHHYQIVLAATAGLPFFRSMMGNDGYIEGWALYAEYLASELGWYDDDPYSDLGRLQYEALRACRMVVDTGIHTMGWEYQETVEYMIENTGLDRGFMEYEVMRYISYPAQATAYLVGKNEILRMRTAAIEALGDQFVLSEFHSVILENGSVPLEVLEVLIEDWVDSKFSG